MKTVHTKRFTELMQRHERQSKYSYFTDEEIEFLGKEDIDAFGEKYPNEAYYYIDMFIRIATTKITMTSFPGRDEKLSSSYEFSVTLYMKGYGTAKIDWGDGTSCQIFRLLPDGSGDEYDGDVKEAFVEWRHFEEWETRNKYHHVYSDNSAHSITITGEGIIKLGCWDMCLTNLDVRNNTGLTFLDCDNNFLNDLDVRRNTVLEELHCCNNELKSLDVSACTALRALSCDNNMLTDLDISHNTKLEHLQCSNNDLEKLDTSMNTALTSLECDGILLRSLDVRGRVALTALDGKLFSDTTNSILPDTNKTEHDNCPF